jgi:hypothetical protein
MVNYNNGKIYKVEAMNAPPEEPVYIGSTTKQYLSQRMDKHRSAYKLWKNGKNTKVKFTVFDIFDKYGIENCSIILLEIVNCNTKEQLHAREAHYIKSTNCVNIVVPLRTYKEYCIEKKEKVAEMRKLYHTENKEKIAEYKKQYCIDNKDKITKYRVDNKDKFNEVAKQYYTENKDKLNEVAKQYYTENKEKINQIHKQYYNDNKDQIKKQKNAQNNCECGGCYTNTNKLQHNKTIKHINYINLLNK